VTYIYLKAIHVMAVITLIGGMLVLAFAVSLAAGRSGALSEREARFIARVQHWDRMVTTPALGLVWIAGLAMAIMGQWYTSPWLIIKMVPVLLLSALHGMEAGSLRRLAASEGAEPPPLVRQAPPVIFACVVLIALLAVVKPF
jgi:uncharacterized membrane protein